LKQVWHSMVSTVLRVARPSRVARGAVRRPCDYGLAEHERERALDLSSVAACRDARAPAALP